MPAFALRRINRGSIAAGHGGGNGPREDAENQLRSACGVRRVAELPDGEENDTVSVAGDAAWRELGPIVGLQIQRSSLKVGSRGDTLL